MRDFFKNALEPLSYLIYAVSVFIMRYKTKSAKKEVLFVYYLLATFLITTACYKGELVNRLIYNFFFFISICFFSWYFKSLLVNKTKRTVISIVFLIHLAVFIKISLISHQLSAINNYVYAATYLSIIVYALLYFDHVLRNVNELNLLHQFDFWLVSGYLLYFLSCFFIILFYDNIEVNQRAMLWSLQNIILFISSVFTLSGSLWIRYQKKYY
jgi:hypothetical protein